ncbi:Cinnamoyl-CoA reductase 1 [Acorus calamus]|uniref:Cinnamoyl-CoA reductase 1 n=1 Tax=Acorus calamus TaxID=4465 RepID=A0AAV9CFU6_ACOCL|nr:Cinnamoyl-CoA reductase 1 [Acorus calamus]
MAKKVCVTGAGGFQASWLVKLLLSRGYMVHGTVRDPDNEKNAHLKKLDSATENLQLFKADLLDYESISAAIKGCDGVFHVACPVPSGKVPNPEKDLIEPAVMGTLNVLKAASESKVERIVVVSSVAAVAYNPNWPKDKVKDEECWSDEEYCKTNESWYCLAKTRAESEAFEYSKKTGLDVVTVCPSLILGPLLQPTVNASSMVVVKHLNGGYGTVENYMWLIVDVRDVAEALILAYENPKASGRYICSSHAIKAQDLVNKLSEMFPGYDYPKNIVEVDEDDIRNVSKFSVEKLKKLGWKCRPIEETLVDAVEHMKETGLLNKD